MLRISGVDVHFGRAHILQGISLEVGAAPVSIIGRNGMGKTTLCRTIMGMLRPSAGSIEFGGKSLLGRSVDGVARQNIAIVPQGRRCFPSLTVDEHLRLTERGRGFKWTIERVYDTFPRLAERRRNGGTQLSGGEQQMLAIARALLLNPELIVMDEPSEGLAPVIVSHLIEVLRRLPGEGMGLLLVEQNLTMACAVSDRVAVMVNGKIAATLPSAEILDDESIQQRFLGVTSHGHH